MTQIFCESFDLYGPGTAALPEMLSGLWAEISYSVLTIDAPSCAAPAWGARTGNYSFYKPFSTALAQGYARRVVAGSPNPIIVAFAFSVPNLPSRNNVVAPIVFCDSSNTPICALRLDTTGTLTLTNGALTATGILTSGSPLIKAETWHFLEMSLNTSTGAFSLYLDGNTSSAAMTGTGLTFASTNAVAQIRVLETQISPATGGCDMYMDDLIVRNTSGTYNNGIEGDLRVATLFPDSDGPNQGWTPRHRQKIGTGILDNTAATTGVGYYLPNGTSTNLGSGDFTLEGFVRFESLPTGSNIAHIFGKWDEANNARSYQLSLCGPSLNSGDLLFRISTDGTAGTVTNMITWPFTFETGQWYHVAVVRSSGELLLFIDGAQYGLPVADSNTYYAGNAHASVGTQVTGTTFVTAVANTGFTGWMDETRWTIGYARYTAPFTPTTTAFPRNSTDDPKFADVQLLAGYDSGLYDESSYLRTLTALGGCTTATPNDGSFAYQVIDDPGPPQDDTFIEAALTAATGTLSATGQFSASETVTVGTKDGTTAAVYTFKSSLSSAFDVLIGTTLQASLNNLIAAINKGAGEGTVYGTGTTANYNVTASQLPDTEMRVKANTPGTGGNSIASSTTAAHASWGGTRLAGGANIPGYSDFYLQRPPNNTTVIKAVQVMTRGYKTDSGTCQMQASLVGPSGTASAGTANNVTTNPTYYLDTFETDPDTSSNLTPATLIGGRIKINRTE